MVIETPVVVFVSLALVFEALERVRPAREVDRWKDLKLDVLSFGLGLFRIAPGGAIHFEQTRVNDEVWLPKHFALKMDAKVVLLKTLKMDIDVSFRDYKKFAAGVTIKPLGEIPETR